MMNKATYQEPTIEVVELDLYRELMQATSGSDVPIDDPINPF